MIRTCPKCNAYYADPSLAFCLADGTPLISVAPDSERWNEAQRVIEEKTRAGRKRHRKLVWRRIAVGAMTTLMLAMAVSKSFVVETIPAGTIPPLTESPPPSSSPLPPELVALLAPSPSPSPSTSPSSLPATSTTLVYKISGRLMNADQPAGGITVTLNGSKPASTTTDTNGNYTFNNLQAGGSYTITPRATMNFTPSSRSFENLGHDESADFTVLIETYKISGRVTDAGQSLAGVKVRLEGSKATATTTDGSGYYAFSDLRSGGSYTITPIRTRMNFTPQSRSFNNLTQDGSVDFTGLNDLPPPPLVCKISGRVTTAGQPVVGARVRLEGSKVTATTTDGSGYYAFNDLRAGGSYTITPAMARMNFTPQNRSFNNLTQDGWADFTGRGEPDSKSISKCTETDENRERRNIRGTYEAGWLNSIRDERPKIIAGIVRDGEVAEAGLRPFDSQISFFEECKVAHVTVRYEWQINTFFNGKPARALNVPKQRRFVCGRVLGGWFCKQI